MKGLFKAATIMKCPILSPGREKGTVNSHCNKLSLLGLSIGLGVFPGIHCAHSLQKPDNHQEHLQLNLLQLGHHTLYWIQRTRLSSKVCDEDKAGQRPHAEAHLALRHSTTVLHRGESRPSTLCKQQHSVCPDTWGFSIFIQESSETPSLKPFKRKTEQGHPQVIP